MPMLSWVKDRTPEQDRYFLMTEIWQKCAIVWMERDDNLWHWNTIPMGGQQPEGNEPDLTRAKKAAQTAFVREALRFVVEQSNIRMIHNWNETCEPVAKENQP